MQALRPLQGALRRICRSRFASVPHAARNPRYAPRLTLRRDDVSEAVGHNIVIPAQAGIQCLQNLRIN